MTGRRSYAGSIFIPIKQGLKPGAETEILVLTSSIFIPIKQGLKQYFNSFHNSYRCSIFIPIKQGLKQHTTVYIDDLAVLFYLHSNKTRIKTQRSHDNRYSHAVLSSFQ